MPSAWDDMVGTTWGGGADWHCLPPYDQLGLPHNMAVSGYST